MATSVEARTEAENSPYVDFDEYVDFQVARAQEAIRHAEIYTNLSRLAAVVLLYVLGFVLFDQWAFDGGFSPLGRGVALGVLVLGSVAWLAIKVAPPFFQTVSMLFAARTIESSERTLQSHLLNLVDLQTAGKSARPAVQRAMEKRAAVVLSHINVDEAVDRRPLFQAVYAVAIALILCAFYAMLSHFWLHKNTTNSLQRLLIPFTTTPVSTQTRIENVTPGNARLLAGTLLTVEAEIHGKKPERVILQYTTVNREFVDQPVEMRPVDPQGNRYRGMITGPNGDGLAQDLQYVVLAGDARSLEYAVDVVQPPSATVDRVDYAFPEYMRLKSRTGEGGHLDTWEGTTVTISAHASQSVKSAQILFYDAAAEAPTGEMVRVTVADETRLTARWTLQIRSDGTYPRQYSIQCTSPEGDVDPNPTRYNIALQPDQRPGVQLLAPTANLTKPVNAVVPLRIRAADDFELNSLTVHLEKEGELVHSEGILSSPSSGYAGTYELALQNIKQGKLQPGDELTYWIEARDNKPPHGQRTTAPGLADRLTITIAAPVTEEEAAADLAEEKQKQQEELKAASEKARQKDEQDPNSPSQPDEETPEQPQQRESGDEPSNSGSAAENASEKTKPGTEGTKSQSGSEASEKSGSPEDGTSGRERPADDQEALQKLLERQAEEQKEKDSGSSKEDPAGKPGDNSPQQEDSEKGRPQRPGDEGAPKPEQPDRKPGPNDQPMPGAERPTKSGGTKPMPSEKGKPETEKPDTENTPSGQPEKGQPGNDQRQDPAGNEKDPMSGEKPDKEDKASPEGKSKQPSSPGGTDTAEGESSDENPDDNPEGSAGSKKPDGSQKSKPGDGDMPSEDKMPGEGAPSSNEPPENGTETPADESPDAVKRKANGDEEGVGTPEKNPDGTEPKAQKQLDRKPGTKPEPNGKPRPNKDGKKPDESIKKPGTAPEGGDPMAQPGEKPADKPNEKRPGQDPLPDQTSKGNGNPDQKSKRPDNGEDGGSTPQSEGTPGSEQPGPGDDTENPGDQKASDSENPSKSKPGDQTSSGSKSRPSESPERKQPGEGAADAGGSSSDQPATERKSPKPGTGNGIEGTKSTEPGKEPRGRPAGQADEEGTPSSQASSGGNGSDRGEPGAEGTGSGGEDAGEEANLEYARKATNLVLKRLKQDLDRGEVDPKLLEELGWTEDDLKRFTDRVERRLSETETAKDALTPEAAARRRQFEAMLESLRLSPQTQKKTGQSSKETRAGEIGSRNLPVPAEYRELYEAYTKGLSRQTPARRP